MTERYIRQLDPLAAAQRNWTNVLYGSSVASRDSASGGGSDSVTRPHTLGSMQQPPWQHAVSAPRSAEELVTAIIERDEGSEAASRNAAALSAGRASNVSAPDDTMTEAELDAMYRAMRPRAVRGERTAADLAVELRTMQNMKAPCCQQYTNVNMLALGKYDAMLCAWKWV